MMSAPQKKENSGSCEFCGGQTGLTRNGYGRFCSNSCRAKHIRMTQKRPQSIYKSAIKKKMETLLWALENDQDLAARFAGIIVPYIRSAQYGDKN